MHGGNYAVEIVGENQYSTEQLKHKITGSEVTVALGSGGSQVSYSYLLVSQTDEFSVSVYFTEPSQAVSIDIVPSITQAGADSYGLATRSLQYETSVILDNLPQPSYSELKRLGIVELGVSIWPDFLTHPDWWSRLQAWNNEAQRRVHNESNDPQRHHNQPNHPPHRFRWF